MTPTDKSMMVEALMDMAFALEIAARDYHCAPDKYLQQELIDARAELRAAIEQYGKEQYARGVNDAWPAGSGEPIAMLHDDGHWTHPPGRDPLDRFSGKVRMEVYAAPQPREPLTEYLRGDALEFAEYLAKQAEYLLTALEYEDMARVAWDESGAGTPEFERWGNATDSRGEHAKKLRERIYEFRKRVPRDPHYPCRSDGRCQYAIDRGAEDMGHCPAGKCAMPEGA